MALPTTEAVALGAIQGLTEFLPISSDGHLALAQILLDMGGASLTLSVLLHSGTLLATLVVLRRAIFPALTAGLGALVRPSRFEESRAGRDARFVLLASLPTAVIGLLGRDLVARLTDSPSAVGLGFLATGALLLSSRFAPRGTLQDPGVGHSLLLGVAQGLAVLPGLSRSGSTIVLALWLGVAPLRAFELSMLMSLPAVLGAVLLEARHLDGFGGDTGAVLVGAAVAFGVGVLALSLLRRSLLGGFFPWFAAWVVPLGLATLALARALPG
ncbi:MAG: undecaprenyl-diphosphate phosphatase [Deltaproteobacteria bacterium]|nr:undecaprenyl-diphosphate phosphatase [Deltaproteobacteria bacterium]